MLIIYGVYQDEVISPDVAPSLFEHFPVLVIFQHLNYTWVRSDVTRHDMLYPRPIEATYKFHA